MLYMVCYFCIGCPPPVPYEFWRENKIIMFLYNSSVCFPSHIAFNQEKFLFLQQLERAYIIYCPLRGHCPQKGADSAVVAVHAPSPPLFTLSGPWFSGTLCPRLAHLDLSCQYQPPCVTTSEPADCICAWPSKS